MSLQAQQHRDLVQALVRDVTAVPLAADVVCADHAQERVFRGETAVRAALYDFFVAGFAEASVAIDTLLTDDRSAAVSFWLDGTQRGPFWGLPCTGRRVTLAMALVCQIRDGLVQKIALFYDAGALLRQLGFAL